SEDCHDAVTGELVHRAAELLHDGCGSIDQLRHDFAQPFRPDCRGDVHRMHDVGEQHGDLLVLGGFGGGDYRRSALVAELVAGPALGPARPAAYPCRAHLIAANIWPCPPESGDLTPALSRSIEPRSRASLTSISCH